MEYRQEVIMKSILKCPVCGEELNKIEKTYRCKNNHTFDMGKQWYVNLHMSNEKRSKNPGDDKNMIISRKNFLEKGYYKKISESLNKIILNEIEGKNKMNILDIGCGEGYYTNLIKEKLDDTDIENHIVGIDISKDGIIVAARSYKNIEWIVASGSKLPIKSDSLDYIICMFSYIDPKEYKRVLKKGGKLITVSTGEYHLVEIKEVVYDKLKMDYYRPTGDIKDGYIHKKLENIKYKVKIETNEDIKSLFDMTPYRWKSPKDGVERLFKLEELEITVDVNIDVFEKN